jgi:hypothetical protein
LSPLQTTNTVLLINVPVALLLHPVLENHSNAEDQDEVDTNDTESGCKDLIKVPVGKRGEWANAATFLGRNEGVGAGRILNEGRCSGIDVSTAIELRCVNTPIDSGSISVKPTFCCNSD